MLVGRFFLLAGIVDRMRVAGTGRLLAGHGLFLFFRLGNDVVDVLLVHLHIVRCVMLTGIKRSLLEVLKLILPCFQLLLVAYKFQGCKFGIRNTGVVYAPRGVVFVVQSVFLCDSGKFDRKSVYTLRSINNIDIAVFDTDWNRIKTKCRII